LRREIRNKNREAVEGYVTKYIIQIHKKYRRRKALNSICHTLVLSSCPCLVEE
jgi:hypothetical protein